MARRKPHMSNRDLPPDRTEKDYFYPSSDLTENGRKARAERAAKRRVAQMEDAPRAMADYREAEAAVRLKTEKLRAARLAKMNAIANSAGEIAPVDHKCEIAPIDQKWAECVINAEDCRIKADQNPSQRFRWLREAQRWEELAQRADR